LGGLKGQRRWGAAQDSAQLAVAEEVLRVGDALLDEFFISTRLRGRE
jgi:hypothetical protein